MVTHVHVAMRLYMFTLVHMYYRRVFLRAWDVRSSGSWLVSRIFVMYVLVTWMLDLLENEMLGLFSFLTQTKQPEQNRVS